ncbi:MAG: hypothetical protein ACM3X9_06325 [Bacillota bacterium]
MAKKDINLSLRSEPDFWSNSIPMFALISWCLTIAALVISCLFIPEIQKVLNDSFAVVIPTSLVKFLLKFNFYLLGVDFLVSAAGVCINSLRHRRRTDKYNFSLIFLTVLSALGAVIYFFVM